MRFMIVPLALVVAILTFNVHGEYTKLIFEDCGSKASEIHNVDMIPMPVLNPALAWLTIQLTLKRPVKTVEVTLDIIRTVSGIKLPVKCYIVDGQNVGSCTYPDLCKFLQDILDEFNPAACPQAFLDLGIDCNCPFNLEPKRLDIIALQLDLPDANLTPAKFLASGDFDLKIIVKDDTGAANQPYGCGRVLFTVKQKK